MPHVCLFDLLPIELLHNLFAYFLTYEILFSFSNINDRINTVLLSYISCRPNFKSIRKTDFDMICDHIRQEQVLSLTLSDDDDTPGQSELFLSRFEIKQFIRLRSLTLLHIEFESLKSIFPYVYELVQLRSFSFDAKSIRYKHRNENYRSNPLLIDTHTRIIPQLNRLHLTDGTVLRTIQLSNLHHLRLDKCSLNELKSIFQNAPQLTSLNICLDMKQMNFELSIPFNHLIRLNLKIKNSCVSMVDMKILLSKCSRLKHFELHITSKNSCFDGNQWEILTRSLLTFNFMIYVNRFSIDQYLHAFRSSFWLEEKRWYVAYYNQYLFSVPHFALAHIDISNQSFIYSTIPTMTNIYNRVTKITIDAIPDRNCAYFPHVDILVLKCSISLNILSSIIDLNRIKVLVLWVLSDILRFIPIERTLPHLWILIVTNCSRIDAIKDVGNYQFEQIRKLKINIKKQSYHNIMKDLFSLFPCVEYLIIHMSSFPSKEDIVRTMNKFEYLTNLSCYIDSSISDTQKTFYQDLYSIIQPSRKSMKDNFKYRFYQSSDGHDSFNIHWWISPYSLEDT